MTSLLALLALSTAQAAPVKATWTAGSSAAASGTASYDAANLGDGKVRKVWVEGESGAGLGAWVLGTLEGTKTLTGMTVWTGSWTDADTLGHYGRPKVVIAEFSDGSTEELTLADGFRAQNVTFKAPHATSSVKLKIKAIHNGKGPDTALSEVVLHEGAPAGARIAAVTASSTYSEAYDPYNAADGALDSVWCEGNASGDGTGEWIEFDFGAPVSVAKLSARVGVAYNPGFFMKANRPTTATLTFSDGSTETLTFADKAMPQELSFPARTTSKVKLSFTGVKKGTSDNDLCLADTSWLP
jgi:hypothetical protein